MHAMINANCQVLIFNSKNYPEIRDDVTIVYDNIAVVFNVRYVRLVLIVNNKTHNFYIKG